MDLVTKKFKGVVSAAMTDDSKSRRNTFHSIIWTISKPKDFDLAPRLRGGRPDSQPSSFQRGQKSYSPQLYAQVISASGNL